jgi:two-component system NtrC family sensor kinase
MLGKQELIDKLTGIRSSRRSYYSELNEMVEELQKKNKQLEVINQLTQIHVEKSWEEVSIYLASQLSKVLSFDRFLLTLIDGSDLYFYISEPCGEDWSCRLVKRFYQLGATMTIAEFKKLLKQEISDHYGTSVCLQNQTGKIYGFLTLLNREKVKYPPEEFQFYLKIGEHVRVSIENIYLYKDVSEKVKIEAQLIQSAKMAAIGEMAAGVAHELNSPLTAILGNVQLLMRQIKEERPQKMLTDIYQCGLRSKKIIQNLLAFSRQEEYQFEQIDLSELVEDVLGLVGYQLTVSGISIRKEIDPSVPQIRGSRHQIEQVLINLLLNAKDAVQETTDPEITIGTGLKTLEGQDYAMLYVHDNGIGIEEDQLDQIFNPFYTTKSKMKGTGLGLSVSLGIVESHGGKLLVDSKINEYSKFSLLLPILSSEGED